jgi:DNA polymerase III subunit delta'
MDWDIIGHDWAENHLRRHIETDRVRHAYLFTGADGIGKRTLALRFIQAINCTHPPSSGGYCGECRPCQLFPKYTHPDLHILKAEGNSKDIKVQQVRVLQRQLALSPYEGKLRIALLLNYHDATLSAANAILKTLEEPPPQVILILTARSPEALLPTIVSRCELVVLRSLGINQLADGLVQRSGYPRIEAQELARMAAGRPGWAIRFEDDPALLEQRQQFEDDLFSLVKGSRAARFKFAGSFKGDRSLAAAALEVWLAQIRDAVLLAHRASEAIEASSGPELRELAEHTPPQQLQKALRAIQKTMDDIDRNANIVLSMEVLMLNLPFIS